MLDAGYAFPEKESGCDELTGGASHKLAYMAAADKKNCASWASGCAGQTLQQFTYWNGNNGWKSSVGVHLAPVQLKMRTTDMQLVRF